MPFVDADVHRRQRRGVDDARRLERVVLLERADGRLDLAVVCRFGFDAARLVGVELASGGEPLTQRDHRSMLRRRA